MKNANEILIELVDNHYGVYIPQTFAEIYSSIIENKEELLEELEDLKDIDNENYWESWETICNKSKLLINGESYSIYQNDDLWALHVDYGYNDSEELIELSTNKVVEL